MKSSAVAQAFLAVLFLVSAYAQQSAATRLACLHPIRNGLDGLQTDLVVDIL